MYNFIHCKNMFTLYDDKNYCARKLKVMLIFLCYSVIFINLIYKKNIYINVFIKCVHCTNCSKHIILISVYKSLAIKSTDLKSDTE